jgi:translocator protein
MYVPVFDALVLSVAASWCSMLAGSMATSSSTQTEEIYTKSGVGTLAIAPPPWVFAVAWPLIHTLLGIGFFLLLNFKAQTQACVVPAKVLYALLLLSLPVWTWLFFKFRMYNAQFVWILVTLVLACATCALFFCVHVALGWFILPAVCWISFASLLSAAALPCLGYNKDADPKNRDRP